MADIIFYNEAGEAVAYSEDGVHIYLYSGIPVAYFDKNSIYSYSGRHLGWFEDGWIRDNNCDCVFFIENAKGGPLKPLKKLKPLKGLKKLKPLKKLKELKPLKPVKSLNWSLLSLEKFFELN